MLIYLFISVYIVLGFLLGINDLISIVDTEFLDGEEISVYSICIVC